MEFPAYTQFFLLLEVLGPYRPSLLAPAGGWRTVHNGALRAPVGALYMIGPFGPPSRMALALAASAACDGGPKGLIVYSMPVGA